MTKNPSNISSEDEYKEVVKNISLKKKPSKILRVLMNSMESYRQKQKYGWSRPWNKYDLVNFQVFKLDWESDIHLLKYVSDILEQQFSDSPTNAKDFYKDLFADKAHLMGFIFVHDFEDNGLKYEGVNLSLGRISNKKYRDRLDIILESPVENNQSQGLKRVRLYADPYDATLREPIYKAVAHEPNETCTKLLSVLTDISWANDEEKLWNHWTVNYIDYFGERKLELENSLFYSGINQTQRLRV